MKRFIFLLAIFLPKLTYSWPQRGNVEKPNVNFSSPVEVNNLQPSSIPELQSRSFLNSGNYLEATVEEVQNILKSNPDLPRLTRGEILDLLENITKDDMEKLRSLNTNRNGKAILLVMPYSQKKGETMEDLYTKKPVTQLVDTEDNDSEDKKIVRRKKPTNNTKKISNRVFNRATGKPDIKTTTEASTTVPTVSTSDFPYVTTSPSSTIPTTVKINFRRGTRPARTRPPTTTRPTRRRRITTTIGPTTTVTPITTSTIPEKFNNEETPYIDKFLPQNAIRATKPPTYRFSRRTTTIKPVDLSVAESFINNVYVKYEGPGTKPSKTSEKYPSSNNINQPQFLIPHNTEVKATPVFKYLPNHLLLPEEEVSDSSVKTDKPLSDDLTIPEDLKYIVKDLRLDSTLNKEGVLDSARRISTIFPRNAPATTTESPITPMPEFEEVADNLSPDMKNLLMSFGLIPNPEKTDANKEKEIGYYPQRAEERPELYVGFKPLPEDGETDKEMDDLLASFGLGRNARKGKKLTKTISHPPTIDLSIIPESMIGIVENMGLRGKPIPIEVSKKIESPEFQTNKEVDRVDDDYENPAISAEEIEQINNLGNELDEQNIPQVNLSTTEALNVENTTDTVISNQTESHNIENVEESKKFESWVETDDYDDSGENNLVNVTQTTAKSTLSSVVFNPTDQRPIQNENDKEQLDKLMELIKTLKNINGSATEDDFKNFDLETLKQLTDVLNNSQRLTLGEQIADELDPLSGGGEFKFNSKRQETTTVGVTPSPMIETSTDLNADTNLLSESFGNLPVEEETEAPKSRKLTSGSYYLIDWNTILEVDDAKGKRVNLRFQPTVGDPSRFYSITNN